MYFNGFICITRKKHYSNSNKAQAPTKHKFCVLDGIRQTKINKPRNSIATI